MILLKLLHDLSISGILCWITSNLLVQNLKKSKEFRHICLKKLQKHSEILHTNITCDIICKRLMVLSQHRLTSVICSRTKQPPSHALLPSTGWHWGKGGHPVWIQPCQQMVHISLAWMSQFQQVCWVCLSWKGRGISQKPKACSFPPGLMGPTI